MRRSVSVVVPVKDGARHVGALLAAVLAQRSDVASLEVLVIDSGSADGSADIARAAGVDVLEIDPAEFGHGRTRNLGAERTSGELICFLTQDATPVPGWLAAFQEAFDLDEGVGAAYGPHLPRPETSPMIARELEEFFAGHGPDGRPVLQGAGDDAFLSNVNAAYRRECWSEIRFRDVPYSEDQAFGREMLERGWLKVFHPAAAVLHAHDYGPVEFMRRYFDEYRGLNRAIGHVEPFGIARSARTVRGLVGADRRWMAARGLSGRERARWMARSGLHHTGRMVFSALGSRADRLPSGLQRRISLEGTAAPAPPEVEPAIVRGVQRPGRGQGTYGDVLKLARDGAVPLLDPLPGMSERERLHIAVLIPPFSRGSGGHNSIFQMFSRLQRRGHEITVWLHDPIGYNAAYWPAVVAGNIQEWFAPLRAPVFKDFVDWFGADVAVATGWQTVYPLLQLDNCRSRAYVVHDHESEFYATSAESRWAEQTYSLGLHAVAASPWLADIVTKRYGGTASLFDFGVDHDVYRPLPVPRRRDTIVFYARDVTARRAVPLGILALEELKRRHPRLRIVFFGDEKPHPASFDHEHLGIAAPEQLAELYNEATVGLCLSMTNYSLIPQEMLACGLPCVDLAGFSSETVFGVDGPVELAAFDPVQLADALERLLLDEALWEHRSQAGREFVAGRTWDRASDQLETGLREALRRREAGIEPSVPPGVVAAMPAPGTDRSSRAVPVEPPGERPATARLMARLDADDVAAIEAAIEPDERHWFAITDEGGHDHLRLALGVWHGIPAVLEKTGLTADEPPAEIHAMARGPLAAGGDLYSADMIADALERLGVRMVTLGRALDFGCSSGRTVRALAAAYPEVEWHGVDPNPASIAWLAEHVPVVRAAVSPLDPPLEFAAGHFDLVYAISVWSHFNEWAARAWLDEMHRILAPGGHLALTVHGLQSLAHYAATGARPERQLEEIRRALYARGFWFSPEFGAEGDHGVVHPEWGNAFMSPEWLLRAVSGAWDVQHYAVGRNAANQDLVVLRRRSG